MTTADVIRLLRDKGVTLYLADNGRLKWRAPRETWTPYLRATLWEYLPEIVYLFNERAAIMQYDGGLLLRAEAEDRAADMVLAGHTERSGGPA